MKKNEKRVAAYKNEQAAKAKVVANLKAKIETANALSPEAIAEVEEIIAEREAEIASLRAAIEELEAGDENHDQRLRERIGEIVSRMETLEAENNARKNVVKVGNFVNSKAGMEAFHEVVKNSKNGKEFKAAWKSKLAENGITPEDFFLPPAVIQEINDVWEDTAANFLSYLDVTGLLVYKAAYDSTDPTADTSRAQGHIKGEEKKEQELAFEARELRPQFIYKYITIDREVVEYEDSTGALMRFIARELAYRVLHEIMRAVLVGDGRPAGAEGKISKFTPVATDTATYTTAITAAGATLTIDEAAEAIDEIEADGAIVAVMSKQTARSLRRQVLATGGTPTYMSMEELADTLGVSAIITTRILNETTTPARPLLIAFVGKAYKVVGDLTMRGFENFILSYNKNEYLTEVYAGGGLVVPKSAVVINPA